MSKRIIYDEEWEIIREIVEKGDGCSWKVNGICTNNGDYRFYGKKCLECSRKESEWRGKKRLKN